MGVYQRGKSVSKIILWPLTIRHLRSKFKVRTGLIFLKMIRKADADVDANGGV